MNRKITKRVISLFLSFVMVVSCFMTNSAVSHAADNDGVIKVACVGDSLTEGYTSSGGLKGATAYPAVLQNMLGSTYQVGNFGKTSYTLMKGTDMSYWNSAEFTNSKNYNADIVIIMLGTNDSKAVYWDEAKFKTDAKALYDTYANLASKPRVIFAVSPHTYRVADSGITIESVAELVEVQKDLIEDNGWETIDMYALTENKENYYHSDKVHFTDEGYAYVAECMYEAVTGETLASKEVPVADMTAISESEYLPGTSNEGPDEFILDNNGSTYWHTNWATSEATDVAKRWVGVSLKEATTISGIRILPRQGSSSNGAVTEYKVQYRETDDGEWIDAASGTWSSSDKAWKYVEFKQAVAAKQVRIVGVHTYADSGNDAHMSLAEFRVLTGEPKPAVPEDTDSEVSLIAKYDFENVSGTTVPNEAKGATGFDGTLNGSNVSVEADTELGNSLKFTEGTEGHMLVENIVNTDTTSYSMALWYKLDTTANRGNKNTVLLQQGGGGRTLLTVTGANQYHTYVNTAEKYSNGTVDVEKWQHVIFVNDAANQKVKFYINGELDSEQAAGTGSVNELTSLFIGRHKNGGSDPLSMRGLVDEIKIYEGIVTDAEAKAIYEEKADLINAPEETPDEPEAGELVLTLDPATVERELDDSVFGINHRYAFNGYGTFDSYLMEVKDDFQELYEEAGFGSIRYPGGTISNLFNWKTTLDSVGRKNQIHGFYNNSGQGGIEPNFGIKEIADFADEVDSEIVYVYSLGRGSVQDAQDLIEFLNAEVGTNPNGGIDWAEVRAESGHPKPYNVRYFEIGNEMQQFGESGDGTWSQGYWLTGVAAGAENAYINGGTASYTKQYAVCEEDWNSEASKSDGSANMVRYMRYANTNPKKYDEAGNIVDDKDFMAIEKTGVAVFVGSTQWTLVDNFDNSKATDKHAVVDYSTGAIHFGDGVNGAIPTAGQQIYVSYQVKRDGFVQISRAMKETTEAINDANEKNHVDTAHEAYIYSSFETEGFISKMASGGYNDLYDGLTIHPYSGTPTGTGTAFYDSAMSLAESAGVAKVQNYVNMLPEGKVPVISEYGIFRSTDPMLRSQLHAIYIAKVLMEYVRLGSPYIQKHCLTDWYSSGADSLGPTQQAVIQVVAQNGANTKTGEGDFAFFATPSARVFQMLNSSFGDEVIASSFSQADKLSNGVAAYSALASKDAYDNYYAAIVNVDRTTAKNVEIKINGVDASDAVVTVQMLSSANISDENTLENPDNVVVETTSYVSNKATVTVEVPKHSFAIVKVATGVDKTALEEAVEAAKDLVQEEYTEASWTKANVEAAVEEAESVLKDNNATTAEVEEAVEALAAATAKLERLTADKTALEEKIAAADTLTGTNYTGDSWDALQQILGTAKNVVAKENATQELVDKVLADLTTALAGLQEVISVSEMTAISGSQYLPGTANEGPDDFILDGDSSTHWHTNWATSEGANVENRWIGVSLNEATEIAGIQYLPRNNGGNGAVTEYKAQYRATDDGEWIDLATGTWSASDKSWQLIEFEPVVAKQVRVIGVHTYADSGNDAHMSTAEFRLLKAGNEEIVPTPVDKTALNAAIAAAEALNEDVYTEESWSAMQSVLAMAKMLAAPEIAVPQKDVDELTKSLEAAIEALVKKQTEETKEVCEIYPDVDHGQWYEEFVQFVHDNDIMTGNKDTGMFNPNGNLLRQQFVMLLWNMEGKPVVEESEAFDVLVDADENGYYADALRWAYNEGIMTGVNGKYFQGDQPLKRQQLAKMLYEYAEKKGYDVSARADYSAMENADQVADYAKEYMAWAVGTGMITGKNGTDLAPMDTATRAAVAKIVKVFCDTYSK